MSTDTGLWTALLAVVLCVAAAAAALLAYRIGYQEGAHDGRASERQRWIERERRTMQRRLRPFPPTVFRTVPGPQPRVPPGADTPVIPASTNP